MDAPQDNSPVVARIHISRPRLIDKVALACQHKLIVIRANAGYGKTTAMTEFVRSAGLRAEWYRLRPADRDVLRFADGLRGCLRRLTPEPKIKAIPRAHARRVTTLDTPTERLVRLRALHSRAKKAAQGRDGQLTPSSPLRLVDTLIGLAAQTGPENVLLVLDDYHIVDESVEVNHLLESLMANTPGHLHFVLLSRTTPHLPLGQWMARQEAAILEGSDLAFTLEETSRFLRDGIGLDLSDTAVTLVHERTEGWAAGISMLSQSLRDGNQEKSKSVLADPAAAAWLVSDYLAEEVFDLQDPATQGFLVRTSILSTLDGEACDYLLDSTASWATLLALENRGDFITSVDAGRRTFRYHQLFREFLRQRLWQHESRATLERLHLRAAQHCERRAEWEDCVYHYLMAGEPGRAAEAVETIGAQYVKMGRTQTVEHWLRAIPEEIASTRPWLLILRARASSLRGRREEAITLVERARQRFQANDDATGQAWAIGEMAYIRFRAGQLQQSMQDFSAALALNTESMQRHWLLSRQATLYRDAGMIEDSIRSCQAAVAELAGIEDIGWRVWGQIRGMREMALTYVELGQNEQARRIAREAISLCEHYQLSTLEEGWALASLGAALWAHGDFEEALRLFNRALSLSDRNARYLHKFVAVRSGNCLRDTGRFAEAEQAYASAGREAQIERAFLAIVSGQSDRSQRVWITDLYNECRHRESIVIRSAAELVFSYMLRKFQDVPKAYEHVREAVRLLGDTGCRLRLASALFHQARIEYELLTSSQAQQSLARALEIADADGYHHFFWWDPEVVAFLCQKALAANLSVDYVSDLASRRLDGAGAALLVPLLQHRQAEVRQRVRAILANLPLPKPQSLRDAILADCADSGVRESLLRAIADGVVSFQGVQILRSRYVLTWREIEVFVQYYLRSTAGLDISSAGLRRACAQHLNVSELTIRCHINNVRGKLGLPQWMSGKRVLDWAEESGMLPSSQPRSSSQPRVATQ